MNAGVDDNLPLVTAQATLAKAQSNLVESLYQYNIAKLAWRAPQAFSSSSTGSTSGSKSSEFTVLQFTFSVDSMRLIVFAANCER